VATSLSNGQEKAVRTFLAVELPEAVRRSVASIQARLTPCGPALKIVHADAMHITIRFLGGVSRSRVAGVESAALAAATRSHPMQLELTNVGTFPGGRRVPRVIWIGLAQDGGYALLRRLFEAMEDELAASGFGRESRAFAPHLTLARVREDRPRADYERLREAVEEMQRGFGPAMRFSIDSVTLFRSDVSPRGAQYTALARWPLGS
jgi:2'-5' RNA ligase